MGTSASVKITIDAIDNYTAAFRRVANDVKELGNNVSNFSANFRTNAATLGTSLEGWAISARGLAEAL